MKQVTHKDDCLQWCILTFPCNARNDVLEQCGACWVLYSSSMGTGLLL